MKKIVYSLFTFFLLLTACGEKDTFTLKGSIQGLPSDTILVYYQNPSFRLDTIIAEEGAFTYTFTPDTFTIFSLLLAENEVLPVFADKGQKVNLKGSMDNLQIEGKGDNQEMAQLLQRLHSLEDDSCSIRTAVDSLIQKRPFSFTNIYLINKYYVQDSLPNHQKIEELIEGLSGTIKDTPYILDLQGKLENMKKAAERKVVSSLSGKDEKGNLIGWNDVKNKYVLLNFWASWDDKSSIVQDSLVNVQKALKKEKFVIVSLSLDMDKQEWLKAIADRDTTQWKQVCDFKGWNNEIVKQQGITHLPANILINPNRRIVGNDLYGEELIEKVKSLIKQDKEREKAEKERRKRNRR